MPLSSSARARSANTAAEARGGGKPRPRRTARRQRSLSKPQGRLGAAVGMLLKGKVSEVGAWLDSIADGQKDAQGRYVVKPDPKGAAEILIALVGLVFPKLSQVEIVAGGTRRVVVREHSGR